MRFRALGGRARKSGAAAETAGLDCSPTKTSSSAFNQCSRCGLPGKKEPGENRRRGGRGCLRVPPGFLFPGDQFPRFPPGGEDARGNGNNLPRFRPLMNPVNACAGSRRSPGDEIRRSFPESFHRNPPSSSHQPQRHAGGQSRSIKAPPQADTGTDWELTENIGKDPWSSLLRESLNFKWCAR